MKHVDPSSAIKEILKSWESVLAYVEKYLPDKAMAIWSANLFNQNMISHFRGSVEPEVEELNWYSFQF